MRALIAGSGGQLGQLLQRTPPEGMTVVAPPERDFDVTDAATVRVGISSHRPDIVLNAAAYTAVDKAESDQETAYRVNAEAVETLAREAANGGARLVHVSTDFVFDGSLGRPYRIDDDPRPLGVYGASKLAGEQAALRGDPRALVVRTAWVYSARGNNFVRTMLRLMRERGEVRVVADQIGTPTHAASLARALWALSVSGTSGLHHFTDAGVASWYDFAVAIGEEALLLGMIGQPPRVLPIATSDYPTPAIRPGIAVLDTTVTWERLGGPAAHWRSELRLMLEELKAIEENG